MSVNKLETEWLNPKKKCMLIIKRVTLNGVPPFGVLLAYWLAFWTLVPEGRLDHWHPKKI